MKNLAIDPTTGDLLKSANNMQKVTGVDAQAQNINSYLQTNTTEIIENDELGIPWVQVMSKKSVDLDFKNAIIKNAILTRPNIKAITSYESEYIGGTDRQLKITAKIKADDGVFTLDSGLGE